MDADAATGSKPPKVIESKPPYRSKPEKPDRIKANPTASLLPGAGAGPEAADAGAVQCKAGAEGRYDVRRMSVERMSVERKARLDCFLTLRYFLSF